MALFTGAAAVGGGVMVASAARALITNLVKRFGVNSLLSVFGREGLKSMLKAGVTTPNKVVAPALAEKLTSLAQGASQAAPQAMRQNLLQRVSSGANWLYGHPMATGAMGLGLGLTLGGVHGGEGEAPMSEQEMMEMLAGGAEAMPVKDKEMAKMMRMAMLAKIQERAEQNSGVRNANSMFPSSLAALV